MVSPELPCWIDPLPDADADVWRMIHRRLKEAGIKPLAGCHSFRATGITCYLQNKGTLEKAQAMVSHSSPRTTKLYDRTSDQIPLLLLQQVAREFCRYHEHEMSGNARKDWIGIA